MNLFTHSSGRPRGLRRWFSKQHFLKARARIPPLACFLLNSLKCKGSPTFTKVFYNKWLVIILTVITCLILLNYVCLLIGKQYFRLLYVSVAVTATYPCTRECMQLCQASGYLRQHL